MTQIQSREIQLLATEITIEGGLERNKEVLLACFAATESDGKAGRTLLTPHTVFDGVKRGRPFKVPDGGFPLYQGDPGAFAALCIQVWEVDAKHRRWGKKLQGAAERLDGDSGLVQALLSGLPAFGEAAKAVRLVAGALGKMLGNAEDDLLAEWPLAFSDHEFNLLENRPVTREGALRRGNVRLRMEMRPNHVLAPESSEAASETTETASEIEAAKVSGPKTKRAAA